MPVVSSGGQNLKAVTCIVYNGTVVPDDGSELEVLSRIDQVTAAVKKLKPVWRDNDITLGSK